MVVEEINVNVSEPPKADDVKAVGLLYVMVLPRATGVKSEPPPMSTIGVMSPMVMKLSYLENR
jgi:hypothetical protein